MVSLFSYIQSHYQRFVPFLTIDSMRYSYLICSHHPASPIEGNSLFPSYSATSWSCFAKYISSNFFRLYLRLVFQHSNHSPLSKVLLWITVGLRLVSASCPSRLHHAWSAAALIRPRPWLGMHIPWSASTPWGASMSFRVHCVKRLHPNSAYLLWMGRRFCEFRECFRKEVVVLLPFALHCH